MRFIPQRSRKQSSIKNKKESTDEVLNMPVSVPQVTPETPHHANAFPDMNIPYEQRKTNEIRFQSGQKGENYNKKAAAPLGEPAYGSHGELATLRAEADAATINSVAQATGESNGNYEQEENYNSRDNSNKISSTVCCPGAGY